MRDESAPEKALSRCRELQCAGQIRPPLPCVEPGLVGDRAPLPEHRKHVGRPTRAPQLPCGRDGDPAHRIMATRGGRGTRGGHRDQQQRRLSPQGTCPTGRRRTVQLPRPGPYTTRQGPSEHPCQPECPALLVGQQNRAYGVLVRRGRVHRRKSRWPGRGADPAGGSAEQRGLADRAQLGARSAAAGAGHRQKQTGQLVPHVPHDPDCAAPTGTGPPLWKTPELPDQPG